MVEVELVEDEPPTGGAGPDPAARWLRRALVVCVRAAGRGGRRAWRHLWLRWLAGGVAAALVVVPVVGAVRDRARLAAFADVTGMVQPLSPGLHPLFRVAAEDTPALQQDVAVQGVLVSAVQEPGGAWSIVGVDARTGARRWSQRTPPRAAATATAAAGMGSASCAPAGTLVVCSAAPTSGPGASAGSAAAPATVAWVLEPTDGRTVRVMPHDEHSVVTGAGGLVVVASQASGPAHAPANTPWTATWQVAGEDPATGAVRWTWTSPPVTVPATALHRSLTQRPADDVSALAPSARGRQAPGATSDDVTLTVADDTWVLGAGGAVLAHSARPGGWSMWDQDGSLLRAPVTAGTTTSDAPGEQLLGTDGSWHALPGEPLWLLSDDGSAPGVLLRWSPDQAHGRAVVSGVDRRSGATLWHTSLSLGGPSTAVLLGGRLYLAGSGLRAIDVTTGSVRWSAADVAPGTMLLGTDGSALLVTVPDSSAHSNAVAARSPADGRTLWTDDLRAAVLPSGQGNVASLWVCAALRRVVAYRLDGPAVVLG